MIPNSIDSKPLHTLRLILGDQLNPTHSWYRDKEEGVLYVIAELQQEAHYVPHHIQKLCAFFIAMEKFASALHEAGHQVLHLSLDKTATYSSLPDLLEDILETHNITHFEYQQPDEYRLSNQLGTFCRGLNNITFQCVDSEHFLIPHTEIEKDFKPNKAIRLEHFYRKMRKRHNILIQTNGEPEQDQWNFDQDNRNKLKKSDLADIPQPLLFETQVEETIERLRRHKIQWIGTVENTLCWPTTRKEANALLEYFCEALLPNFGRFQDAMTCQSEHSWSLYHSRLAFALNTKMLSPLKVIQRAIEAYRSSDTINIAQIEGFVRQILGWREYVRGMYWINMPDYATKNALDANNTLPDYFWTSDTKMMCMSQSLGQSLDQAYAHHIQRLMVIGNFCLLTEMRPDEVDTWYLGVYIDAIEWVEMPNTRGMSQYADGGLIASKPYAASGSYINRMSDYCGKCHYKVKEKTGDKACPFNSLYWRFMLKHRKQLERNPRSSMLYKNWDKQSDVEKSAVLAHAQKMLDTLNHL